MEQEDINGARGKKSASVKREIITAICILDYDSLFLPPKNNIESLSWYQIVK